VAVCDTAVIDLASLPPPLGDQDQARCTDPTGAMSVRAGHAINVESVADALNRTGWNVSSAAALLGVSRATLHRRLHDFKLTRPPLGV
jgi:transcriptional regulator of acetoin/glycerol metabolism